MSNKPNLTNRDILTLIRAFGLTIWTALIAVLTGPFRGPDSARTYKQHVVFTAIKCLTSNLPGRLLSTLSPSTSEVYKAFAKKKGFEPVFVDTGSVQGGWIGDPQAETTVLWFHGGGYAFPAQKDHMKLLAGLVDEAKSHGREFSVLVIQYDLSSQSAYPRQLEQAISALRYLIEDMGKSAQRITLAGDSAGGNLALGVVSHLCHPHPCIPALHLPSSTNLKGLVLVSPWVTFSVSAASFQRNKDRDCISAVALSHWTREFLQEAETDNYNDPLSAPHEWWSDIPVTEVLVTAGEDEVLVDDIVAMTDKLKKQDKAKIHAVIAEREPHDAPIMEATLGRESETSQTLKQWVLGLVSGR